MPLKFVPEVTDCTGYGPGSSVAQRANCISFNIFCHIDQQVDVLIRTVTILDTMQYFFHPASSFTTRGALSATLMMVEPGEIPGITHDTLILVKHHKATGPQHRSGHKTAIGQ